MKISTPRGHAGGAAPPSANLGPPHISETIRARMLKFYTHLDRTKCSFWACHFSLGCAGGGGSGGRPGGLKLQCPAIATFSSFFILGYFYHFYGRNNYWVPVSIQLPFTQLVLQLLMLLTYIVHILKQWQQEQTGQTEYYTNTQL